MTGAPHIDPFGVVLLALEPSPWLPEMAERLECAERQHALNVSHEFCSISFDHGATVHSMEWTTLGRGARAAEPGFPSPIASKLTGVTLKTLENWAQRGFLKPSIEARPGNGARRVYSFRDLIAIRVADDLRSRGIEVRHLRRVIDYLRKRKGLDLSPSDVLASTVLLTDGRDVVEVDGDRGVHISALRHPDQSVLMVPLGRLVAKIHADAEALHLKGLHAA